MKVLMPFYVTDEPRFSRYVAQLKAIENNVDELHICYLIGKEPKHDFNFHLLNPSREINIDFSKPYIYRFIERYFRYVKYIQRIPKNDYDVLYCLSGGCMSQFSYLMIRASLNLPTICRIRGNGLEERRMNNYSYLKENMYNWIEKKTFKTFESLCPISLDFKNELESRGYTNVSNVIPNGIDIKQFKPDGYPDKLTIGFIGRLSKIKGVYFLLELMEKTPDINYIVAGANEENVTFPNNVRYLGFVDHDLIPAIVNLCSLTILASYSEGLSNSLLESYACGRPMIMTKQSHPIDIPVFGYELNHDIKEWKNVLESLNNHNCKVIGKQARKWAENLSWEKYGERMALEFRRVLNDE